MINGKKIVGLCMTRIYDASRAQLTDRLHRRLEEAGMKLIVFNSFVDFYYNDEIDAGARSIYDLIRFDVVDALVIHDESFYNKEIIKDLQNRAKEANVPVIMLGGDSEGCYSVSTDYRDAYTHILRHVVEEHHVTDTAYMAGRRENDKDSERRLACYRRVLEENNLPWQEENIFYGDYWEKPTLDAMESMMQYRCKPPRAIFCANDSMAYAVCDWLKAHGWQVPEDVIVTGYDYLPFTELFSPELTSCSRNPDGLAELIVTGIREGLAGKPPRMLVNQHIPIISESCGCPRYYKGDYREFAKERHLTIQDMETHETQMFVWLERILKISDMNTLYNTLSGTILPNSYMCLRSNYLAYAVDEKPMRSEYLPEDELLVIPSYRNFDQAVRNSTITVQQMIPFDARWADGNTMFVLSAVHVRDQVCGYYAAETESILSCSHNLKRVQNTLNIAFNVSVNYIQQMNLRRTVERAAQSNPVTGLPNLKGAVEWYQHFKQEHNDHYWVSVSVYGMPKFSYIAENYGVEESEETQRFVAECLKMANPRDCFVAHVQEDLFMVLNYYHSEGEVDPTIGRATSAFYSQIESFNKESSKEYYIEVNAGCTVVEPGWGSSLESLIKFANSDMYMNRLQMGMGKVVKEEESPKEHYRAFEMLMDKNMFHYHFQPIIDLHSGDIYGYEALMRTDATIGLNPLQVLAAAKEYGRLYEIEKATLFNIMGCVADRRQEFAGRKVFINTIPGHFLKEKDLSRLIKLYGKDMSTYFFELTEQDSTSDSELATLRRLSETAGVSQIAIDDFGTGHSNIVNLLRYSPQVIKIDRELVQEICKSQNKQHFVRNVVDFAKMNNILTLAEGVETSAELQTIIHLGVDLVQGYYTGRPQADLMHQLPEEILKEILDTNAGKS